MATKKENMGLSKGEANDETMKNKRRWKKK